MSLTADVSERGPARHRRERGPVTVGSRGFAGGRHGRGDVWRVRHEPAGIGRAPGYECGTCGSTWQVMRCQGCRKASVVLEGTLTCPRCGHDHQPRSSDAGSRPSWLTEPDPLSVWLGGVKYLGGHRDRDRPVGAAGLLLDRRGIHLRAFAELFSIRWHDVRGIDIEGPLDIAERLTHTRLLELGATTWSLQVAYLTVRTVNGDGIFEVDGLSPPELHARLSRVLQGLERSELPAAPISLERRVAARPEPGSVPEAPRAFTPATAPLPPPPAPDLPASVVPAPFAPVAATPAVESPTALAIDPASSDAPIEVLVVDALWKLAHLREVGLLDDTEVGVLRVRLLGHVAGLGPGDTGPLLRV